MEVTGEPIRGVIFDLDGVLIESADCHRAAFQQVLRQLGVDDFEYAPYAGWRTREVVEDVARSRQLNLSEESINAAARQKSLLARKLLQERPAVAPGCESLLANLAASYRLALASSGSRTSVASFLKLTGSRSLFFSVLSGDDVAHAKPHPEIYLRSAAALGLSPCECVVVEDAVSGVQAARAAGAQVVGLSGTVPAKTLREAGAHAVASDLSELAKFLPRQAPVDASGWTAIIPAAGRGSRLGFQRPKILYPVAGRLILDWLLDSLEGCVSRFVFVLSPAGVAEVSEELGRRVPGRFDIAIQETPKGMGDAVAAGLSWVRTAHVAILWGDQVALRRSSVQACLSLHAGPLSPEATVPTLTRANPYIHFERDESGNLVRLRQRREGDDMPAIGESDAGFFCFETQAVRQLLKDGIRQGIATGAATGECNFLPVIPLAASRGLVLTPRIVLLEETIGINSSQDVAGVEKFLRSGHGCTA